MSLSTEKLQEYFTTSKYKMKTGARFVDIQWIQVCRICIYGYGYMDMDVKFHIHGNPGIYTLDCSR